MAGAAAAAASTQPKPPKTRNGWRLRTKGVPPSASSRRVAVLRFPISDLTTLLVTGHDSRARLLWCRVGRRRARVGRGRAPPQFEGVRYNPTTNRWMAFVRGPRGHEYFLGWFDSDLEVRDAASV